MQFTKLSNDDLVAQIQKLCGAERELMAQIIVHLMEVEDRRVHLESGYSSMFEFCQWHLGMSEDQAYRRIGAARLARKFPSVLGRLERGEIHLTTLMLLREHLTEANHEELLSSASNMSKRAVEKHLATRFPKADVLSNIHAKSRVEPLSATTYAVELTFSEEELALLESVTELMRHRNPTGDIRVVIVRGLEELRAKLEKERFGKTSRPQKQTTRTAKPDHVTQATRREVFQRDGEQCSYVSPKGERCASRSFLEIDHVHARALGGASGPENLRPLCANHNRWLAEQAFGREHVERKIRESRSKAMSQQSFVEASASKCDVDAPSTFQTDVVELVSSALVNLDFRRADVRRALDVVMSRRQADPAPASFDGMFRAALAVLT